MFNISHEKGPHTLVHRDVCVCVWRGAGCQTRLETSTHTQMCSTADAVQKFTDTECRSTVRTCGLKDTSYGSAPSLDHEFTFRHSWGNSTEKTCMVLTLSIEFKSYKNTCLKNIYVTDEKRNEAGNLLMFQRADSHRHGPRGPGP